MSIKQQSCVEAMKQALEALNEVTGWTWAGPMRVMDEVEDAITTLRQVIEQTEKQKPVAWATREDFYRELDRSVNRMRQQMEIKAVLMRCTNYDLALPIIDVREGHVLVGQVTQPKREWVGLTNDQKLSLEIQGGKTDVMLAEMVEKWLKEMNT